MFQLLCTRVNAASTLTQHALSTGSVATRRHGSCNSIGYIKSHPWLWLVIDPGCGRSFRLSLPVSLQTARGRNDAEIVWRCQVEMERRRGRRRGGGAGQTASISTWSLSDSLQLRCVASPHKPAKAKSCYCCYPSIPAKSGTMLPGNSSAHKQCHKPADSSLKENSPSNPSDIALRNMCHLSSYLSFYFLICNSNNSNALCLL